jgi:hypothetical protein
MQLNDGIKIDFSYFYYQKRAPFNVLHRGLQIIGTALIEHDLLYVTSLVEVTEQYLHACDRFGYAYATNQTCQKKTQLARSSILFCCSSFHPTVHLLFIIGI